MKKLTVSQIIDIHKDIIEETGGSTGIRDFGLLESAAYEPFQTFDGEPLYPSIQQKAARLAYALAKNHPFVDGNKRIGIHAMLVFLQINGIELVYTQKELVHWLGAG
jgi:death-on-curing protein